MLFNTHQRWFPRDPNTPELYEDASAISRRHNRAVIADGVSSAIFSRSWARLLTRAAVVSPPLTDNDESLLPWVTELQHRWSQGIDFNRLGWSQREKLRRTGGQSTLMIVDIRQMPLDEREADGNAEEYRLVAHSIGDCCLYLVREGEKIFSFPMTDSAAFEASPYAFSSIARGIPYAERFQDLDTRCRVGDLVVLCTDAIASWAMREYEAGKPVDWLRYRDNETAWQEDLLALRNIGPAEGRNRLVVDDCTLVILEITADHVDESVAEIEPDKSDEPFALIGQTMPAPPSDADVTIAKAAGEEANTSDTQSVLVPGNPAVLDTTHTTSHETAVDQTTKDLFEDEGFFDQLTKDLSDQDTRQP
jgi:hypothetical protein